jgi:hypothetical protein
MTLTTKSLLVGAGLLALAACGGTSSKSWNSEAGAFLDEGGFGNPTMTNMMAQMCKGRAKGFIEPDPIVALDAKTAPGGRAGHYRGSVYCSGQLNGQYAQVIWREYIRSGRPASTLQGGGLQATEGGGGGG